MIKDIKGCLQISAINTNKDYLNVRYKRPGPSPDLQTYGPVDNMTLSYNVVAGICEFSHLLVHTPGWWMRHYTLL